LIFGDLLLFLLSFFSSFLRFAEKFYRIVIPVQEFASLGILIIQRFVSCAGCGRGRQRREKDNDALKVLIGTWGEQCGTPIHQPPCHVLDPSFAFLPSNYVFFIYASTTIFFILFYCPSTHFI